MTAARHRAEEYLLERRLLRSLTSGEVINPHWAHFRTHLDGTTTCCDVSTICGVRAWSLKIGLPKPSAWWSRTGGRTDAGRCKTLIPAPYISRWTRETAAQPLEHVAGDESAELGR